MKTLALALFVAVIIAGLGFHPAAAASSNAVLSYGICGFTYKVKRGDSLANIARLCRTTVDEILTLNPRIVNPNLIFAGQVLHLSGSVNPAIYSTAYTVQSGDTLYSIAARFGVSVWEIQQTNLGPWNNDPIYAGQVLYIPSGNMYSMYPQVSLSTVQAQAGDTVTVDVTGFPANADIDMRIGKQGESYSDIFDGIIGSDGTSSQDITISYSANEGEYWVVVVATTSQVDAVEVTSDTIYITN